MVSEGLLGRNASVDVGGGIGSWVGSILGGVRACWPYSVPSGDCTDRSRVSVGERTTNHSSMDLLFYLISTLIRFLDRNR